MLHPLLSCSTQHRGTFVFSWGVLNSFGLLTTSLMHLLRMLSFCENMCSKLVSSCSSCVEDDDGDGVLCLGGVCSCLAVATVTA